MTTTPATVSHRFTGDLRADALVGIIIGLALITGFIYQRSLAGQITQYTDPHSGFAVSIPKHWTVNEETVTDTFIEARDSRADSFYKSSISGQSFAIDTESPATLDEIVDRLVSRHGEQLISYHLLDIQPTTVAGVEARAVEYAYVAQPIDDPFMAAPPVVVIATDYVIYTADEYWVVTLAADEKIIAKTKPDFDRIIASITLPSQ